jgi:hypothetical protein
LLGAGLQALAEAPQSATQHDPAFARQDIDCHAFLLVKWRRIHNLLWKST